MAHLSKRAEELTRTFGTVGNLKKLTRQLKAIKKIEDELKLADANITRILRARKRR